MLTEGERRDCGLTLLSFLTPISGPHGAANASPSSNAYYSWSYHGIAATGFLALSIGTIARCGSARYSLQMHRFQAGSRADQIHVLHRRVDGKQNVQPIRQFLDIASLRETVPSVRATSAELYLSFRCVKPCFQSHFKWTWKYICVHAENLERAPHPFDIRVPNLK